MTLRDAFTLGRVSNLPTVWTNVLAGIALAGAVPDARTVWVMAALTLFYVGGMYLNDAFDAEIDAHERPERPIPSGRVSRSTVSVAGGAMLFAGVVVLYLTAQRAGTGAWAAVAGLALAGAILLYDWHHKANPLSPVVMGACRMLVYLCAASAFVAPPPAPVLVGAVILLCYLVGLTYVAKQENLGRIENLWPLAFLAVPVLYGAAVAGASAPGWIALLAFTGWMLFALHLVRRRGPGDIPRAVVSLIAGICLLDAVLLVSSGAPGYAALAGAGFALTLLLQRFVPGT